MKRDSGPSKLPPRIRGRLSLPASVSILKRKAWDVGCPLLPQAHGRQQGASPAASPFSRCLSVLYLHRSRKNPFAAYCLPPAHGLLCASSEHTALSGFPAASIAGWCSVEHVCAGWVGGPGPLPALAGAASLCPRPQLPATPLPWLLFS